MIGDGSSRHRRLRASNIQTARIIPSTKTSSILRPIPSIVFSQTASRTVPLIIQAQPARSRRNACRKKSGLAAQFPQNCQNQRNHRATNACLGQWVGAGEKTQLQDILGQKGLFLVQFTRARLGKANNKRPAESQLRIRSKAQRSHCCPPECSGRDLNRACFFCHNQVIQFVKSAKSRPERRPLLVFRTCLGARARELLLPCLALFVAYLCEQNLGNCESMTAGQGV